MQKLIIDGELPGLNTIILESKKHWSNYSKIKKTYTLKVISLIKQQKIKCISNDDLPISLEFNWYCKNKKKDPDNIASAKKFIIDGLVTAKIIPNDGWSQIKGFNDKFFIDKNSPRIEVIIVENG